MSFFSRYSTLQFTPDPIGDLVFNGVASNIYRSSLLNGVQADAAIHLSDAHTLRIGTYFSGEQAQANNLSTVFATDADGNAFGSPFAAPATRNAKVGYLVSGYAQDEWRLNSQVTLNAGLRFDQMYQYTDANQLSPRLSMTYKPLEDTTVHAGYARYFTPPSLVLAGPTPLANYAGTTLEPAINRADPLQPERSNVFDLGVDQKIAPGLTVGVDAYYKQATDLLDDGNFGQALVLDGFNYAKGENEGIEAKVNFQRGNWLVYANVAYARQVATNIVSNQYLFDPDEFAYIASHYIPTDHAQRVTASAGFAYTWQDTRFSGDMIFGSGLRDGFANLGSVPAYTQFNFGVAREFRLTPTSKPLTVRFDIVNAFDSIYEIRDGSGIGVFAPQYGPRRGFYLGISQKL